MNRSRWVGLPGFLVVGLAQCPAFADDLPDERPGKNRPFVGVEVGYRHILSAQVNGAKVQEDPGNGLPLPSGFFTGVERSVWGPFSVLGVVRVSAPSVDWGFARGTSTERIDVTLGPGLYIEDFPPWTRFRVHFPLGPAWMTGRTWEARLVRHSLRPRTGFTCGVVAGFDVLWGTPGKLMSSLFAELGGHFRSTPYRLESAFLSGSSSEATSQSYLAYDIYGYLAAGYAMHF